MRIGRTLPPAAAPLSLRDLFSGVKGMLAGSHAEEQARHDLTTFFNKKHCFLVSSGKAALTLILLALKELHPDRDQVLIPAFACYSVPSAIVRAGLKIQLCDIDLKTLDYDYDALSHKLNNPHLLCVLSVHLFGLPADVERLLKMRPDPAVTIIEDAAQAMGGEWKGKKLGTLGDVGFFSLGRGKALTAVEGGLIITDDESLAEHLRAQVRLLPACGFKRSVKYFLYAIILFFLLRPELFWIPRAMPFLRLGETFYQPNFTLIRMGNFQAGLLNSLQKKIAVLRSQRQENTRFWCQNLSCSLMQYAAIHQQLPDIIRFPLHIANNSKVNFIIEQSDQQGLGVALTYPDAIHGINELVDQFDGQEYPSARKAARELVTLPVHGLLSPRDREQIFSLLQDAGISS